MKPKLSLIGFVFMKKSLRLHWSATAPILNQDVACWRDFTREMPGIRIYSISLYLIVS